jgi:hypothetical protein
MTKGQALMIAVGCVVALIVGFVVGLLLPVVLPPNTGLVPINSGGANTVHHPVPPLLEGAE